MGFGAALQSIVLSTNRSTLKKGGIDTYIFQKYYKQKFIFIILLIFFIVLAVSSTVLYITTKDIVEEQLGQNARGVAVAISLMIMDDIEEYKAFIETKDVNSEYYKKMQNYFQKIKSEGGLKFIYTERKNDSESIEFILDAEPIGSINYSPPGSMGFNDWKREIVYNTGLSSEFKLYDHPIWGKVIVAYAPLYDRNNEFLGIIGVNFDGGLLFEKLNNLFIAIVFTSAIIMSIIFVVLLKFSDFFIGSIIKDSLTGAYNKSFLGSFLLLEMKASIKNGLPLSVLMIDLDHFKSINDTYGHIFGDKVLQYTSKLMKQMLRKNDCLARYGGEEFIVVLTDTDLCASMEIAEKMRKAIEASEIFNEKENVSVKVTISIGVAQMTSSKISMNTLIENADKALYTSKLERNKVSGFGHPII